LSSRTISTECLVAAAVSVFLGLEDENDRTPDIKNFRPVDESNRHSMNVPAVPDKELSNTRRAESSETIRHRIITAVVCRLRDGVQIEG